MLLWANHALRGHRMSLFDVGYTSTRLLGFSRRLFVSLRLGEPNKSKGQLNRLGRLLSWECDRENLPRTSYLRSVTLNKDSSGNYEQG